MRSHLRKKHILIITIKVGSSGQFYGQEIYIPKKHIVNVHKSGKRYKTIAKDYCLHQRGLDDIVQMDKMQSHSYFSQDIKKRFFNKNHSKSKVYNIPGGKRKLQSK